MNSQLGAAPANSQIPAPQPPCVPEAAAVANVRVLPLSALSRREQDRWRFIQQSNPALASPYFTFEFSRAVSRVRDDVQVALFDDPQGHVVALFPFQRPKRTHVEPVGGRLNDVHGLICQQGLSGALTSTILDQMGAQSIGFHAAIPDDPIFRSATFCNLDSHFLDFSEGWPAYYRWARNHSSTIKRHGQKSRALEREVGKLRFDFHSPSLPTLERLIELKRSKYRRTRTFDILSVDWAANLLREIQNCDEPGLQGVFSVLWAGDQFVAGHIGMISENQLHYWFPVFDPQFSKYSPGTELLLRVSEEACRRGITKLDLGYGDDAYKFKFSNATESLGYGLVTESRVAFELERQKYFWRLRSKQIPLKPLVKKMLRTVYPGFGGWNFR